MTRLQVTDENRDTQALFQQSPHVAKRCRRVSEALPEFSCEPISILSWRLRAVRGGLAPLEGTEVDFERGLPEHDSEIHQAAPLFQRIVKELSVAVIEVLERFVAQEDAGHGPRNFAAVQERDRVQRERSSNVTQLSGRNAWLPVLQRGEEGRRDIALAGQLGK